MRDEDVKLSGYVHEAVKHIDHNFVKSQMAFCHNAACSIQQSHHRPMMPSIISSRIWSVAIMLSASLHVAPFAWLDAPESFHSLLQYPFQQPPKDASNSLGILLDASKHDSRAHRKC